MTSPTINSAPCSTALVSKKESKLAYLFELPFGLAPRKTANICLSFGTLSSIFFQLLCIITADMVFFIISFGRGMPSVSKTSTSRGDMPPAQKLHPSVEMHESLSDFSWDFFSTRITFIFTPCCSAVFRILMAKKQPAGPAPTTTIFEPFSNSTESAGDAFLFIFCEIIEKCPMSYFSAGRIPARSCRSDIHIHSKSNK